MYNVKRFKPKTKEPVYITKYGVKYEVLDVCGVNVEVPAIGQENKMEELLAEIIESAKVEALEMSEAEYWEMKAEIYYDI